MKRIILISFFIVLLFASNAFAALEVYTYGTGDFVARAFTGLAMLSGSSGVITGLVKLALLVGLLSFLLSVALPLIGGRASVFAPSGGEGIFAMIRQIILAAVAVYAFMIPKTDVLIIDKIESSNTQIVPNVPLINAVFAYASSQIGFKVGEAVDSVTADVDAVRFTKTGYLAGPKYIVELLEIQAPGSPQAYGSSGDVSISAVIQSYYERCIFPQMAWVAGEGTAIAQGMRELRTSSYLPQEFGYFPFADAGTVLNISFKPCQDNIDECTNCLTAQNEIITKWNSVMNGWFTTFNKQIGIKNEDALALISRYFPNTDSGSLLVQLGTMNTVRSAFLAYAGMHGVTVNYGNEIGMKKVGEGWIQMSRLFDRIVVTIRQIIEGLVYLLSAFLPVFFVVGGIGVIGMYLKITLWLQLWVPLLVIVNNFADLALQKEIQKTMYDALTNNWKGPSFDNIEALRTGVNLVLGYIGAFSWSVPPLAWGLLKGGEYAMSHAMSAISSGAGGASTAQSFGSELGAGNLSVGNQSLGNRSFLASSFAGSSMQGALAATRSVDIVKAALDSYGSLGSGGIYSASLFEMLNKDLSNLKTSNALGGAMIAADKTSNLSAGDIIGKVNAFSEEAQKRGITTMSLASQNSEFKARTGLAGMDARFGFANYMVQSGLASNIQDAYYKMAQEGLIPGVGKIQAYGGDMKTMLGNQATLESARIGDVSALRNVAEALYGGTDDNTVRKAQEFLKTSEGMNEAAKFVEILDIAKGAGIKDQWEAFLAHQQTGVEMRFTADQAERFFGFGAPAGNYRISRDEQGNIIAANMEGGFKGTISNQIAEHSAISPNTAEGKAALNALADAISSRDPNTAAGIRSAISRGEAVAFDITRTKEGEIAYLKSSTGALFSKDDFRSNTKGWENVSKALYRTETGVQSSEYNINSKEGIYSVVDPNTGKKINVSGKFLYDSKGNLVAANYTNLQTGEIFTAQQVTDRGKTTWQYGVGKVQVSPDGKMRQTFTSLSERDVSTGGYASHQTFAPDGTKLYEKADAGQQVTWWHQFKMNFEKGANVSALGGVVKLLGDDSDLTNLNSAQTSVIYAGGATKVAVDRAMDGVNIYKGAKMPENAPKTMPHQPSLEVKPKLYDPYGHLIQ